MKIYITGPAGSWKSTLARKLGEHFEVPTIHLDELLWNNDWTENEDYGKLQKEAIAKPDWIIEWPSCSIVKSMSEVDRIVILDYPPLGNIWRILLRRLKSTFGKERIGVVLPDKLTMDFIHRTFVWRKRQLPRLMENIRSSGLSDRVLILESPNTSFQKVSEFLINN